jgi:two-component system response regulator SaeR
LELLKDLKDKNNIIIKRNNIFSSFIHTKYSKYNNGQRILIVDDDLDIVTTLKKVLEVEGYTVNAFSNPIKALEEYRKDRYSLIILDIKMPQMNGFELYYEIRKIDNNVDVCFLTAGEINPINDNEIISKNLFLRKPIENEVLLKAIENIKKS